MAWSTGSLHSTLEYLESVDRFRDMKPIVVCLALVLNGCSTAPKTQISLDRPNNQVSSTTADTLRSPLDSPASRDLAAHAGSFNPKEFFLEGTEYKYKAGTRGFSGGMVRLRQVDNILWFEVDILILGAGSFSRTNYDEVLELSKPAIPPEKSYFEKPMLSFSENPMLIEQLEKLRGEIELQYSTKFTKMKLNFVYGDDSKYLSKAQLQNKDYQMYMSALIEGVNKQYSKKKDDTIPVRIVARPEANRASPPEWDLYSDSRYFAHELFHIIGSLFEGYECDTYPPIGIQQDGTMFFRIDNRFGKRTIPQFLLSDLLELLGRGWGSVEISPVPQNLEKLESLINSFSSSALCSPQSKRGNWLNWSSQKRISQADLEIEQWFGVSKPRTTFLIE